MTAALLVSQFNADNSTYFQYNIIFNPLLPSVAYLTRLEKNIFWFKKGLSKKFPLSVATMSR